eukprot:6078916-Amphidinium_carterae.1
MPGIQISLDPTLYHEERLFEKKAWQILLLSGCQCSSVWKGSGRKKLLRCLLLPHEKGGSGGQPEHAGETPGRGEGHERPFGPIRPFRIPHGVTGCQA